MTAIRVIRLLRDATVAGRIRWQKHARDGDRYEASLAGEGLTVRFVRFARADRATPDRHLAELDAFGVTTDHTVGTEGFELICDMLSHGDPAWSELRTRIRQRMSEAEEVMHLLLAAPPPPKTVAARGVRANRTATRTRALR